MSIRDIITRHREQLLEELAECDAFLSGGKSPEDERHLQTFESLASRAQEKPPQARPRAAREVDVDLLLKRGGDVVKNGRIDSARFHTDPSTGSVTRIVDKEDT